MGYPSDVNLTRLMKIEGRFCIDPTDLGEAFPHGGMALGVCQEKGLRPQPVYREIRDEGTGEVIERMQVGEGLIVAAILRGWSESTLEELHPNASGDGEDTVFAGPARDAGTLIAGKKVLFSPFDSNHPGFIIYRALPYLDESAELAFAVDQEVETALVFEATRDATGRLYQWGKLAELSL